ncbi:hypothetical protein [Catellatospora vulcania]|nr:hypothetical protein [Catellatospora vulcania]
MSTVDRSRATTIAPAELPAIICRLELHGSSIAEPVIKAGSSLSLPTLT